MPPRGRPPVDPTARLPFRRPRGRGRHRDPRPARRRDDPPDGLPGAAHLSRCALSSAPTAPSSAPWSTASSAPATSTTAPHDPVYVAASVALHPGPRAGPGAGVSNTVEPAFSGHTVPGRYAARSSDVTASRVLGGEQSNTSIVCGVADLGPVIVKVFRTLSPGANPDVVLPARPRRRRLRARADDVGLGERPMGGRPGGGPPGLRSGVPRRHPGRLARGDRIAAAAGSDFAGAGPRSSARPRPRSTSTLAEALGRDQTAHRRADRRRPWRPSLREPLPRGRRRGGPGARVDVRGPIESVHARC
jgi:hypothetical protein